MKKTLESLIFQALEQLKTEGVINAEILPEVLVERSRDARHGDYAVNSALVLARIARLNPRQLAEKIVDALPGHEAVAKVEIAGPGFINFFVRDADPCRIIRRIHEQGSAFGVSQAGAGKKIQVEFVSANPTGPLHVGHGRGAAYGSAVAALLKAVGFEVYREYYINDAGRQMDILAASVWLRYLERCGETPAFPVNGYRGDYVREIADALYRREGGRYRFDGAAVFDGLPPDEPRGGDKEDHIDALIARAKSLLGDNAYKAVFDAGLEAILDDIKADLREFRVDYDSWFSERQLLDDGSVEKALARLQAGGYLYRQDGAVWFASSRLGDEKDRVVIRENGQHTYFASDIAYHMNKLERGFDRMVDIWGADHHGYIPRVKAAIQALGADDAKLEVLLVQFATLYRGREKVQMSTRSGEFITLRELRGEVGTDAARFFYLLRRNEQHMDFDLDLAASRSNENPVFYVQYAHARVCSVFRQLAEKGGNWEAERGAAALALLTEPHEQALMATLARYPETLERAALQFEPHQLIHYLRELANDFHTYYNAHQFLVNDADLRAARLSLIGAVKQVLANALGLLGINAPDVM